MKFLQALDDELIVNKPSCCLTKSTHKITMLLYYNIPMSDWKHDFTPETLEDFYTDFTNMAFSITLTDLPFKEMFLQEQSLTYENGSAYETWVKGGWHLVTNADSTLRPKLSELHQITSEVNRLNEPIYTSFPVISNHKITADNTGSYTYECRLKPFEIRLVEFIETSCHQKN